MPCRRFMLICWAFRFPDYIRQPFPIYLFHSNSRHHSFAIAGLGAQGNDLTMTKQGRLAFALVRHTNDYTTKF